MTGTFQGIGTLQFTPDNKRCFYASGRIAGDSSDVEMINFSTNSEYIVGVILIGPSNFSERFTLKVNYNDTQVFYSDMDDINFRGSHANLLFTIPPFTNFTVTMNMTSGSTGGNSMTFNGDVYGTIEQFNLETINE